MNSTYLFKTLPKRKQLISVTKASLDLKDYEQAERLDEEWAICRPLTLDSFQPAYSINYIKQQTDSNYLLQVSLGTKTIVSEAVQSGSSIAQILETALPDQKVKQLTIRSGLVILSRSAKPIFALSLLPKIPPAFGLSIEACADNLLRAIVYHQQTEAQNSRSR